jgi:hypothetical protein
MKYALFFLLAVLLGSCNTMIGIGRDTKEGYYWSKRKIQERRKPAAYEDPYGGPVY